MEWWTNSRSSNKFKSWNIYSNSNRCKWLYSNRNLWSNRTRTSKHRKLCMGRYRYGWRSRCRWRWSSKCNSSIIQCWSRWNIPHRRWYGWGCWHYGYRWRIFIWRRRSKYDILYRIFRNNNTIRFRIYNSRCNSRCKW